jgi:hypothetical protein
MVDRLYALLVEDGVVVFNVISSLHGPLLATEVLTLRTRFPQVLIFPVARPREVETPQNVIIVALKSKDPFPRVSPDPELERMLSHLWAGQIDEAWPILTDEYAPVDFYALNLPR